MFGVLYTIQGFVSLYWDTNSDRVLLSIRYGSYVFSLGHNFSALSLSETIRCIV